jgi:hypothetical protein
MLLLAFLGPGLVAPRAGALDAAMPFTRAVAELAAGPAAARALFVEIAAAALAERVRTAAGAGRKDAGWARGARAYAAHLDATAAAAGAGAPVRLLTEAEGLRVVVGRRPARQFVLVPPRSQERARLERTVIERLCARLGCGGGVAAFAVALEAAGTAAPPLAELPAVTTRPVPRPARADGVVPRLPEGPDGLACGAPGGRHARLYAGRCAAITAEARALVAALHARALAGCLLDWQVLAAATWRERGQGLIVNVNGDTVVTATPLLARYRDLYDAVLPWLRARLGGQVEPLGLTPPARLVYAVRAG